MSEIGAHMEIRCILLELMHGENVYLAKFVWESEILRIGLQHRHIIEGRFGQREICANYAKYFVEKFVTQVKVQGF